MRLLVCGGRKFRFGAYGRDQFYGFCSRHRVTVVIHGDQRGADREAGALASKRGLEVKRFPPDWAKYGPPAGPIRNQRMLDEGKPDLVLACPGGSGTADMIRRAVQAGVPVHYLDQQPPNDAVNEVP